MSSSSASSALRLTGRDVLPVLHRVTTQALADLAPGEARTTLFCDFRGRLLHRACVLAAPDGAVWLLRDDAPGAELAAAVDRVVFREDVAVADLSDALPVHLAPGAAGPAAFDADGVPRVAPADGGFALLLGEPGPAPTCDERARIAAGRARSGAEVRDAFTPYEVGLGAHVHLAKGCYTGQESLQRLVTYSSVRRGLALVRGAGAPPAPQDVLAAGEPAGALTSAVADGPGWLGLAVVRLATLATGAALALASGAALGDVEPLAAPAPLGR